MTAAATTRSGPPGRRRCRWLGRTGPERPQRTTGLRSTAARSADTAPTDTAFADLPPADLRRTATETHQWARPAARTDLPENGAEA